MTNITTIQSPSVSLTGKFADYQLSDCKELESNSTFDSKDVSIRPEHMPMNPSMATSYDCDFHWFV